MNKLTPVLMIGASIVAGGLMAAPAQAALFGSLQRGQTQYVEVNLDPGKYLFYVSTAAGTKEISEASLSIYEPNGKLIRKSRPLPPDLQIADAKQGTWIEITRPQTVYFEIHMDKCPSASCAFGLLSIIENSSGRGDAIALRSKLLPTRPSYGASSPNASKNSGVQPAPAPRTTATTSQPSGGQSYVFRTNSHVNTGISVNAGDKITVRASGRVRFGMFAGAGGPRGIMLSPSYNYFTDILHGQLIGRVREFGMDDLDGWLAIGEGREFTVKKAGTLEFAVNDNRPGDNAGAFRVEVTVNAGK
jgi:hypothetical protein